MARMRHVFPTGEIAHLWAAQNPAQPDARNPQGNLFFDGATIYSYRTSWPLARIYRKGKGAKARTLVLTNSGRYGVTTAGHQRDANNAVSQFEQIAVPYPVTDSAYMARDAHEQNIAHLVAVARQALDKAQRGRSAWLITYGRESAQGAINAARQYMQWFKVKGARPKFDAASWEAAAARMERLLHPDPKSAERSERARAKAAERRKRQLQSAFDAYAAGINAHNEKVRAALAARGAADPVDIWRAHGVNTPLDVQFSGPWLGYRERRKFEAAGFDVPRRLDGGIYTLPMALRLSADGREIESTRGARIPVDHAPRIWALVQACRSSGRDYVRNGHTEHAGVYSIDRVTADGTLTAGCHTIPYAELERMARTLGYIA